MGLYLAAFLLITISFIGLGTTYFFFGKLAKREPCGSIPTASHEDCPSQKNGLCPVEDLSGTVKLARRAQINRRGFPRHCVDKEISGGEPPGGADWRVSLDE